VRRSHRIITSILLADDAVVITLTRFDLICSSYLSIYLSIYRVN
jgi:hypothetical protein